MPDVFQCLQYWRQPPTAYLVIKTVGKRFQVYVGSIHGPKKLYSRRGIDVSGSDGHSFDITRMASGGDVHRVFEKNNRVIVGKGHTAAAQFLSGNG